MKVLKMSCQTIAAHDLVAFDLVNECTLRHDRDTVDKESKWYPTASSPRDWLSYITYFCGYYSYKLIKAIHIAVYLHSYPIYKKDRS